MGGTARKDLPHRHEAASEGAPSDGATERKLFRAMLLTGGFMLVEVAGGLFAGSLALLADAGHMLTDTAALALAWGATQVARRPADPARSYGYHRFPVLAAFANGLLLIGLVIWLAVEAVERILAPHPVLALPMLVVAGLGLMVNLLAFRTLHGGHGADLNLRGAALHVLSDLLGSVAALIAAVVILLTGWMPIDALLSLLVAALLLRSAWLLVQRAAHILLEGTPLEIDVTELSRELPRRVEGLQEVHHLHAWSLSHERPLVTLHARVKPEADRDAVLAAIKHELAEGYGITHSTVQVEEGPCIDHRPLRRA